MITVNLRTAKDIVRELYKANEPAILMGSPGIGKTSIFTQVAEELSQKSEPIGCKVTEASSLDPTDTRGLMYVVGDQTHFSKPAILPKPEDGLKGMLVVDELASCLPATQVSLYPLYLERRLGDYKLLEGWVPMGTGNYTTDGAVAYNLSTALSDRVCMLNVEPDFKIWKEDYAIPRGIDPIIISFLNYRTELFYTFDKRDKSAKGKAFASPRSYEKASNVLKTGLDGAALMATLSGYLGEGVATELMAFRKTYLELPDVGAIYEGKYGAIPKEPSVLYALSGALISYLNRLPKKISMSNACDTLLDYTTKLPAEYAVITIKDAMPLYKKNLIQAKNWNTWSQKYKEVVL